MINKKKLNNLTNEIWKSAERLRGKFKAYEYQNVLMPMIVIRRLECVLIDGRSVMAKDKKAKQPDITDEALAEFIKKKELSRQNPLPFSNTTEWTLRKISDEDPTLMEKHFRDYINGFSENVQEIINKFDFRAVIGQMVEKDRLSTIITQYATEPLGPENISNLEMGYIYEELLRRFSEQSGEEAGEHFTPREVIRLMVELLDIQVDDHRISIYDPACGTGGMLSVAKEHILESAKEEDRDRLDRLTTLYGQELQDQNYAICKSDMLIKGDKHSLITCGNSLIPDDKEAKERGDQHATDENGKKRTFDYMLSNPPFGVTWGGKDGYADKVAKLASARYSAGMPPSNDGAYLFLQTMIEKMKAPKDGGSKIAIVFNGSPLSNGDCGSGPSEIRRWILENDYLEAIVMLPDQLFYNTGISTYVWLLTNVKSAERVNKVQIIDARKEYEKEPKSFGNKRNRMVDKHHKWIENTYKNYVPSEKCKIFNTLDFAYHKVAVTFWQTDENDEPAYKTTEFDKAITPGNFKKIQEYYGKTIKFEVCAKPIDLDEVTFTLELNADKPFMTEYTKKLKEIYKDNFKGLKAKEITALIKTFTTTIKYTHPHYIDDSEYIPYGQNIEEFLNREIAKEIIRFEDAAQLGYEFLPNKYFYKYEAPKPTEDILKEFWALEKEAESILKTMGRELA